jgi:protein arginine kinase
MDELLARLAGQDPAWWPGDATPVVFGRLQLSLNVRGPAFPAQLSSEQRTALSNSLAERLWSGSPPRHKARLRGLTDEQREFLSERWLLEPLSLPHDDARLWLSGGEERGWLLMGEDHVRLDARGEESALVGLARGLDAEARAWDSEPGLATGPDGARLTANPFLCGSGCHAALVLHLPALAWWGQVEDALDPLYERGLCYRTWQEGFGDFLVLENVRGDAWPLEPAAGDSEDAGPAMATLARLMEAVRELLKLEEAAREQLRKHRRLEVEDKLHRALAICRSARLLGYPELVEHLSLLRLGAQLPAAGWHLPELSCPVTPLLLRLAPAHLAARSADGLAGRQAAALRARLLRAALLQ